MLVAREMSIREFEPWCGAVDTRERIIGEGLAERFDALIEELYPDGIGETMLNDILWFDGDWVLGALGIEVEEE